GGPPRGATALPCPRPARPHRGSGARRPLRARDARRRDGGAARLRPVALPPERPLAPRGSRALPRPAPEQGAGDPRAERALRPRARRALLAAGGLAPLRARDGGDPRPRQGARSGPAPLARLRG